MTNLHHHHTSRPRRQCSRASARRSIGYTLIELLLVIGILGLCSILLVPHLVNRDSMNAQAAVRLIIGDITFAQSDALAHQEMRRIHFYDEDADGHCRGYCLTRIRNLGELMQPFDEGNAIYVHDPLATGSDDGNYIVDFSTDDRFRGVWITGVDIDGGSQDLHFDELGGTISGTSAPGTGGSLIVESGVERYQINMAPFTGKLSVIKL
jgi:type II secretory pathway pseudopilin PulG